MKSHTTTTMVVSAYVWVKVREKVSGQVLEDNNKLAKIPYTTPCKVIHQVPPTTTIAKSFSTQKSVALF